MGLLSQRGHELTPKSDEPGSRPSSFACVCRYRVPIPIQLQVQTGEGKLHGSLPESFPR